MNYTKPGSGNINTDFFREERANAAANALSAGKGILCRSADHLSASELCTQVIARKAADPKMTGASLATEHDAALKAIDKLRNGIGHHKAQADHTGSQTCAQVIAAAT